ncbi:efflux RND transporter periplasmic adaptor subunit [Desulfoluna spongiiphila]|uniref:RND family efflux transporter, MFP subunit n=1 Tax=Desulfoluna spongiiphila TaxID=419481 RepID=A0A1G5IK82_9BACT|nr:efflux RND transporter periplasmic adaptor subunit [Desulfoluna spongiiphila]SCY76433.1 RND family efflux transporter, MFP subunit [Desulfoluna spongiiphila]VVS90955.1 rnd efflux pump membrane fusion protein [Desulfoluna spongiiphila]
MKAIKWITIITLLALPVLSYAEGPAQPPARVVTSQIQQKTIAKTLDVVGTLQFDRISALSPQVSGQVEAVLVKEGDQVKQGAPLFRLNLDFVNNEIGTVRKKIAQVEIRLVQAKKDLTRYETLFKQQAASEQEYDKMRLSMEDLAMQKATLQENLALALLKKEKSIIRAPFAGVVLEKNADEGNWVTPGNPLCLIGSMDDLYVKVPMPENLLVFARTGEELDVTITALGLTTRGTITGYIPVADAATKNIFVKVMLPRLETAVLNMSATVAMPASDKQEMTLVPRDALVTFNGQTLVYTINEGAAAPLPVTILAYVEGAAGIAEGPVTPGMDVIIDGNDRLQPGQPVTVIEAKN